MHNDILTACNMAAFSGFDVLGLVEAFQVIKALFRRGGAGK